MVSFACTVSDVRWSTNNKLRSVTAVTPSAARITFELPAQVTLPVAVGQGLVVAFAPYDDDVSRHDDPTQVVLCGIPLPHESSQTCATVSCGGLLLQVSGATPWDLHAFPWAADKICCRIRADTLSHVV